MTRKNVSTPTAWAKEGARSLIMYRSRILSMPLYCTMAPCPHRPSSARACGAWPLSSRRPPRHGPVPPLGERRGQLGAALRFSTGEAGAPPGMAGRRCARGVRVGGPDRRRRGVSRELVGYGGGGGKLAVETCALARSGRGRLGGVAERRSLSGWALGLAGRHQARACQPPSRGALSGLEAWL